LKANWDIKPIYDVIVRIPGSAYPDEWVVRGNHHDAWVNGADDPVSGTAALMEEARALAALLKEGWKPKRTIIYCVWDAEEQGLIGSTEWGEAHADELRRHAVAYINTDSNGRGYLNASGSHSLEKFMNDVARDIVDPEKNIPVWKRRRLKLIADAKSKEDRDKVRARPDWHIGALGSGSDYTVFIDHLGVASLNLGYGGEDGGGIYHSIYDDFYWYTHFSDTDFTYGRALAQTVGTAVMRLANAELLPYDFTHLADTVRGYADDLKKLLQTMQDEIREQNRQIEEGVFDATADPKKTFVPPSVEEVPPHLNFAPLENGLDKLTASAADYHEAWERAQENGGAALARASLRDVNAELIESERKLTNPEGLPGRPWYKHQIYAPGAYTGYGVKTIPGVREAIEQKKWQEANQQLVLIGKILEDEAALIESAAQDLQQAIK
jgi:N-acetylated-alpha-linked acidic dipeptidase